MENIEINAGLLSPKGLFRGKAKPYLPSPLSPKDIPPRWSQCGIDEGF